MKILAVGDSFTYGDELSNRDFAWPSVLGAALNATVINKGQSGGSNDCIVRTCVDYISSNDVDLVIIGWTSPGRSEFADVHGYYDVWPGYAGKVVVTSDRLWRNDLVKYITKYHRSDAYFEKFLVQVLLLQGYLTSKGIKYVMLNTIQNEHYKKTKPLNLAALSEQVNKESFIEFGKAGMIEWTFGCPKGPGGHFLEEGHQKVADKIYEHIRHLGWVS